MLKNIRYWLLLLIAASMLLLPWLSDSSVYYHDDEWLYMKIAGEMFDAGEYWIPLWMGEPAYYKPPMTYWIMMLFFPFGEDRLPLARFSIALCSLATVLTLYRLGRLLSGNAEAGLRAGLFACTTLGFIAFGKIGMLEMPMVFFMTTAMYCFACAWHERSPVWAGLFLAWCGASALVKGPVTVLVLGLTAFLLLLFYGRWKPFFSRASFWGGLVGLAFVGLWPAALYFKGEFPHWFAFFIIGENFGKFADALQYPTGPFLVHALQWCLPWTFLLFASFAWLVAQRRLPKFEFALPLFWGFSIIAIHLLPDTKLAWYMFLPVPACMLFISGVSMQARKSRVWLIGRLLTLGLFGILAGITASLAYFLLSDLRVGFCLAAAALFFALACQALWRDRMTLTALTCVFAIVSLVNAATLASPAHYPTKQVAVAAARHEEVAVMRKQVYLYTYAFKKKAWQFTQPDLLVRIAEHGELVIVGEKDLDLVRQASPTTLEQLKVTPQYKQWLEELPPDLIRQALLTGNPTLLQENVFTVEK